MAHVKIKCGEINAGSCGAAFAADAAAATQPYVPSPINIGWEVYVGAIAGVIPFAIGSYQFVARIVRDNHYS